MEVKIFLGKEWADYELIDTGNFMKLEMFGKYVLIRPEPQALWKPYLSDKEWNKIANGRFIQEGSHSGNWEVLKNFPERWYIQHKIKELEVKLRLARTKFKHIGIFPEQCLNWEFVSQQCNRLNNSLVLNLFAYTGAASVVAAKSGGKVTHIDSVKQVVSWANENAQLNGIENISWVIEDALKFVKREVKRGKKYQGILLDPPAFGHGANGERWQLEDMLNELLGEVSELLDEWHNFFVINCYSMGLSPVILLNLLRENFNKKSLANLEFGELCLQETGGGERLLPLGIVGRFWN